MKRIFTAIEISGKARSAVARHVAEITGSIEDIGARWVEPEKLHITLRFFGNVDDAGQALVESAAAQISHKTNEFDIRIAGTGAFPEARPPKVLWLGLRDEGELNRLRTGFDELLTPSGFETEGRNFSPHLTIARIKQPGRSGRLVERHLSAKFEPVELTARGISVYESVLKHTGSEYAKLFETRFRRP